MGVGERAIRRTTATRFVVAAFLTVVSVLAVAPYSGAADSPGPTTPERSTIDFESGLAPMNVPAWLSIGRGVSGPGDPGSIAVTSAGGPAMVFDADCGGSAATCAGWSETMFSSSNQHHVLMVADNPDALNVTGALGASLTLQFQQPMDIHSFVVHDLDTGNPRAIFQGADGTVDRPIGTGEGQTVSVTNGPWTNVDRVTFLLDGSGFVDDIVLSATPGPVDPPPPCPTGEFWNPSGGVCEPLPCDSPLVPTGPNPECEPCADGTVYVGSPGSASCEVDPRPCVLPQVYDAAKNECVDDVPPCTTPAFEWDGVCVTECPAPLVATGSVPECEPCPTGQVYVGSPGSATCEVDPRPCVAPQVYDAAKNECVDVLVCTAPAFEWDGVCVTECPAPLVATGSVPECEPCPAGQVYVGSPGSATCEVDPRPCVLPQVYDAAKNECVDVVPPCTAPAFEWDGVCVTECPSPLVRAASDPLCRPCVLPQEFDAATKSCVTGPSEGCVVPEFPWNGECVTECPSPLVRAASDPLCRPCVLPQEFDAATKSCETGPSEGCALPLVSTGTGTDISCECPSGEVFDPVSEECISEPDCELPRFVYEDVCVEECPEGTHQISGTPPECVVCGSGEVFDPLSEKCIVETGCELPRFVYADVCVEECPEGTHQIPGPSCEDDVTDPPPPCPPPLLWDGNDCVTTCVAPQFPFDDVCAPNCPEGLWADIAGSTCEPLPCPTTQIFDAESGTCESFEILGFLDDNDRETSSDVMYDIVLFNRGPGDLPDATITLTLPEGLEPHKDEQGRCTADAADSARLVCTADLSSGADFSLRTNPIKRVPGQTLSQLIGVEVMHDGIVGVTLDAIEPSAAGPPTPNPVDTAEDRRRITLLLLTAVALMILLMLYRTDEGVTGGA